MIVVGLKMTILIFFLLNKRDEKQYEDMQHWYLER